MFINAIMTSRDPIYNSDLNYFKILTITHFNRFSHAHYSVTRFTKIYTTY